MDIIHKSSLAVHCILAILLLIGIIVNAVSINKAYASINANVDKLNENYVNSLKPVNDNMKKLADNSLSMLTSVNDNVKKIADNSLSMLTSFKSNVSTINSIKNVLSPDLSAPLTEDCMNSEYCSLPFLKNKFSKLTVTNANQITNKGSATSPSVLLTNRLYFSDANWYSPFYMPTGVEGGLLFLHVNSSWSVEINKAFTNMDKNIIVGANNVAAFMYKNDNWELLNVIPANKMFA